MSTFTYLTFITLSEIFLVLNLVFLADKENQKYKFFKLVTNIVIFPDVKRKCPTPERCVHLYSRHWFWASLPQTLKSSVFGPFFFVCLFFFPFNERLTDICFPSWKLNVKSSTNLKKSCGEFQLLLPKTDFQDKAPQPVSKRTLKVQSLFSVQLRVHFPKQPPEGDKSMDYRVFSLLVLTSQVL